MLDLSTCCLKDHYPCFFQNSAKICLQNLENITWRVVWFSFTDQCWSWNYNEYGKTCIIFAMRSKGKIQVVSSWPLQATQIVNWNISPTIFTTRHSPHVYPQLFCVPHLRKNQSICNASPKWKEVNCPWIGLNIKFWC
jgi:hypothetical protein